MDHPLLAVTMRYLHIVSAVIAVGGTSFMLACMLPSLRIVEDSLRESLLKLASERFLKWLYFSIAGLLISGIYNWVQLNEQYNAIRAGQPLIGTKVLLAMILFGIIGAQGAGIIKPGNPRRIMMINVHLAAIIILLGSILRYLRLEQLAGVAG